MFEEECPLNYRLENIIHRFQFFYWIFILEKNIAYLFQSISSFSSSFFKHKFFDSTI